MTSKRLKCLLMKKPLRLNKQSTKQKEERIFSPLFLLPYGNPNGEFFCSQDKKLKLNDGADLAATVLNGGVQTVLVAKVGGPRAGVSVLGRRPSVGAGCEFCPTSSAESRIDNALIVII